MELILDGIKLMVMGMGTVLVFLVVMIFCMNVMAKLIAPIAGILDKPEVQPKRKTPAKGADEALRAAAAVAALQTYKSGK